MTEKKIKRSFKFKYVLILFLALVTIFIWYAQIKNLISYDSLSQNRELLISWRDNNYAMAVVIFIITYILVVTLSLPGASLMTLTGGFLFSVIPGFFYNIAGATAGAILIFLATKTFLGDFLYSKIKSNKNKKNILDRMNSELHENEFSYLLILRLMPMVPFFIANLAPAFLGIKLRTFAITTFLGISPGTFIYTSVGSGLGAVFDSSGSPDLDIIFEPIILISIISLIVLAGLPIFIKKMKKGRIL
jgi:uncharacterized membrane protein YdjX (TVP38/TMEM64 family)